MKQYCLFILIFYLVLTIQYARSVTYKEWYDKYVRNCTAGSTVKSYKANTVCICSMPGVIESCKYIGMQESSATVLRLPAWNPQVGMEEVEDARKLCKEGYKGSFYQDCNICYCTHRGQAVCTLMKCPPKKEALSNNAVKIDKLKKGSAKNFALLKREEVKPNKKKLYALKEKAQNCKSGEKFKEPYGCNWCTCIEDGVVVCDTNACH